VFLVGFCGRFGFFLAGFRGCFLRFFVRFVGSLVLWFFVCILAIYRSVFNVFCRPLGRLAVFPVPPLAGHFSPLFVPLKAGLYFDF
jgi:hypothetical protein